MANFAFFPLTWFCLWGLWSFPSHPKQDFKIDTKLCFKKIGSPYILVNCSWRKKDMIKTNTSLKRWFWVEEYKALKTFKKFENEDEKWRWKKWRFFLLGQNISNYTFLKLWTSLISDMYSDFSYVFSIKGYSLSKWVHFACFCPFLTIFSLLWRAVIFDRSKIWKIRKHIWNQRSSKFQKNIF